MRKLVPFTLATLIVASCWMAACGSSAEAPSGGEADGKGANGNGASGSGASGNGSGGLNLGMGAANGNGLGGDVGSWQGEACADGNSGGNLEPIYLVFLLDQSGSMGDNCDGKHYAGRWQPVVSAMGSFFADPASAGLYASLTMFPTDATSGTACGTNTNNLKCNASDYEKPVVDPTKLPNDTAFAAPMKVYPNEYGTPTYPALSGTITYAESLKATGKKVAIVMVTDGEPTFCGNDNTIANTASQAADAFAAGIPTYVLGVGSSLDSLNTIAADGGTDAAFIIDPTMGTPEETQQALLAQINKIRGAQASCEMTIPDPPAGKTLDPAKVNVEYTTGGTTTKLLMNADCGGDKSGWHYDNAANPTKITLCSATCTDVKAHDDAALNVVFGCDVRIDPK